MKIPSPFEFLNSPLGTAATYAMQAVIYYVIAAKSDSLAWMFYMFSGYLVSTMVWSLVSGYSSQRTIRTTQRTMQGFGVTLVRAIRTEIELAPPEETREQLIARVREMEEALAAQSVPQ